MSRLKIGLIGTGYMGKCHALAYNALGPTLGCSSPERTVLCDIDENRASSKAQEFGFARHTTDWRALVADPNVDIVSIATPNALHRDIAIAALENGKHVYCEKPMALTLADADRMVKAAEQSDAKSLLGYNYLRNPAIQHGKKLIDSGALGRILFFRGINDEDYMADENTPFSWRCVIEKAGTGTLGDLGSHLISLAQFLIGPIEQLCSTIDTPHKFRHIPDTPSESGEVENEDICSSLLKFQTGVTGIMSSSRVAWGAKNRLAFEVHGSKGTLRFDQERMNELQFYKSGGDNSQQGFKRILSGPDHPPYSEFVPSAGHQLGFNDLKVIELDYFLRCIRENKTAHPNFSDGLAVEKVIHGIVESARTGAWLTMA